MKHAAVLLALAVALGSPSRARAERPEIVAIVETRTLDVSPVSGAAVTRQLYATAGRLGYRTVPETVTAGLAARLPPGEPTPAALLQIAEDAHATRAIAATLGAHDGRYVVSLALANSDRTGPFFARDAADSATLEPTTDRLARQLLPAAPPPEGAPASDPGAPRADEDLGRRLAVQSDSAFGLGRRFFFNELVGARLDYGFPGDFALGAYLGYANLKGKEGRAHNVLPYAQLEYRLHVSSASGVRIPFRFGSGYLPKNGPFLRVAAGLSIPLGGSARLGFDLLCPTVWVVKNSTVFSMDVAAEVSFGF